MAMEDDLDNLAVCTGCGEVKDIVYSRQRSSKDGGDQYLCFDCYVADPDIQAMDELMKRDRAERRERRRYNQRQREKAQKLRQEGYDVYFTTDPDDPNAEH